MQRPILIALPYCLSSLFGAYAQVSPLDEARIKRVETGLTNTVLLQGKSVDHYSLAQRMRRYHVRGLSVAVVDHYQIAWTKGYGLADIKSNRAADLHLPRQ